MDIKNPSRTYKIEVGDKIKIKKQQIIKGDKTYTFYKTSVTKKNYDGQIDYYEKQLTFKSDVELNDGDYILIKKMFEDVRPNPRDKYTPIWLLHIMEFEKIDDIETSKAIEDYNKNFNNGEISIRPEDMPF